jgi:7-carboxy-7-deazaguanine synthase
MMEPEAEEEEQQQLVQSQSQSKSKKKIPISEIFYSLQGEGVNCGKPSVFVRFATCNLSCGYNRIGGEWVENGGWKCDAWYTWQDSRDFVMMSTFEIYQSVKSFFTTSKPQHVVFTGGEPLLRQEAIAGLVLYLISDMVEWWNPVSFEVESNCTIIPDRSLWDVIDWWDLSPKLSNSGIIRERRVKPDVVRFFLRNPQAYFKFVIRDESDVEEMETDYVHQFGIPPERVILMPEGTDESVLKTRGRWIAEICKRKGYRFTPRLQIELWGDKRGT